jgi:two-component system, NtrC family, sensor kinase
MSIMPRRLAQKLILSLTIIVIIIGAISGLYNLKTQERHLVDAMILGADQLSKGITSATWHLMLANNLTSAYEVMQTIALKQGIDRIRIFNREGDIRYSTRAEETPARLHMRSDACVMCHESPRPKVRVDAGSRVRISRAADGRRSLTMVTPIYNEPSCSQAACHAHPADTKVLGVLDVTLNLDPVDRELADMKWRVFLVTGVQILLISVFIIFFTRYFVGVPIRKLIEGTKQVSRMNLDKPIDIIHSSEELDDLARSFNIMRERLRQAMGEINEFTQSLETKVEERTQQLKVAHQKLLQSDRLASLGQLAASVAHEINNPVSGVLNLSMLMQRIIKDDGVPPDRIGDFRRYLGQVVNETSRVGRIVSDLLAFSRRSKPQRAQAELNKIVRTTLSLVQHKLRLNNVEAELDLAEVLPTVLCDNSQIQQVVVNLVLNAAEATYAKGNGRVRVRTGINEDGSAVVLSVTDNGEGIAPENMAKIFDPFFTTKPEGKGVGLGLAVLYGIVQEHGGDIDVKSKVGEGTTFRVTLPLITNQEVPAPAGPAENHA